MEIKSKSLEIVAFTAGAVVMIFELVGSRILAPYFGTSTFVWTSIIGIILGSLSLGYFLGGKLADQFPSYKPLILILVIATILLSTTAITENALLDLLPYLIPNIIYGSTVSTIILFAPTSLFLGMVSPYTVRLKMTQVSNSGSTVGNLYALSTFGSIVGTFFAGFVLIPNMGIQEILLVLIATLLTLAIILLPHTNIKLQQKHITILFFFMLILTTVFITNPDKFIQTAYSSVEIKEGIDHKNDEPIRVLFTGEKSVQASVYKNISPKKQMVFEYLYFFDLFKHFAPNSQKFLAIGAGVYTHPQYLMAQNPNYSIDVVEIDPKITEISKKFFNFDPSPQISIFHEDARTFMNRNTKIYDTIFIDAFTSNISIPFHLTTKEFIKTLSQSLSENGMVIVNVIGSADGENEDLILSFVKTYLTEFEFVGLYLVDYPNSPETAQNISFVATKKSPTVSVNSSESDYLNQKLKNYFAVPPEKLEKHKILTDNFAPVEMMTSYQAFK